MQVQRRTCLLCALLLSLVLITSCSRDPYRDQVNDHPRRFELNGKGYILNENEPGVIEDDIALYTADAGARTFKYGERIVLTELYAGTCEAFASLAPAKQRETEDLAKAALGFIWRLEKTQHRLSEVDRHNLDVFSTFLKSKPSEKKTPSSFPEGKQVLEIPPRGESMPTLLIEVPIGFKLSEHEGSDFYVYYLRSKSAQWGANMGIYLGHNPQHPWPKSASKKSGIAGSFPFIWQVWSEQDNGKIIYHRDAIIEDFFGCCPQIMEVPRKLSLPYDHRSPWVTPPPPPPPPDPLVGLAIHIFVVGSDLGAVNTMASWVESLHKKD